MSVEASTGPPEEIQIDDDVEEIEEDEEEEEVDEEDEEVEEDDEEEEIEAVTHGRSTGRGLTLKTLLKEGVLQPGEGTMTINYLVRLGHFAVARRLRTLLFFCVAVVHLIDARAPLDIST